MSRVFLYLYLWLLLLLLVGFLCKFLSANQVNCPQLSDADDLSQTQFLERLIHACHYDRFERPVIYTESGKRLPVDIYVRFYVYFMQQREAHDLQFKMHALLQLRFMDPRLAFQKVKLRRNQPIIGEKQLRDKLWMPHIFLANERGANIMSTNRKDVLIMISPDGTVTISKHITITLNCWMNLRKFPFDEQYCSTYLESWLHNTSELHLHWDHKRPNAFNPNLHLTEYIILKAWPNESSINGNVNDLSHGALSGNYSSLSFTVHLTREVGFYLMDYFLPSMLIVGISWVSFWLQADQAPPRIMLGTSTMLTFITLASVQDKAFPKVSYIKASEVWFLGCTLFIFASLLEFAFVNTIWRREGNIDVKKRSSRHVRPAFIRDKISRADCFSTLRIGATNINSYHNYLPVNNLPIRSPSLASCDGSTGITEISGLIDNAIHNNDFGVLENVGDGIRPNNIAEEEGKHNWTTLTPQEISQWIDCKARILFPLAFLVFNLFYWTFVYIL